MYALGTEWLGWMRSTPSYVWGLRFRSQPRKGLSCQTFPSNFFQYLQTNVLWMLSYFVLFSESLRSVSTNKYVPMALIVAVTTTWKSLRVFRTATLVERPPRNSVEIGVPSWSFSGMWAEDPDFCCALYPTILTITEAWRLKCLWRMVSDCQLASC